MVEHFPVTKGDEGSNPFHPAFRWLSSNGKIFDCGSNDARFDSGQLPLVSGVWQSGQMRWTVNPMIRLRWFKSSRA